MVFVYCCFLSSFYHDMRPGNYTAVLHKGFALALNLSINPEDILLIYVWEYPVIEKKYIVPGNMY